MFTEIRITPNGEMKIGEYEPGNGTRYTLIAMPWDSGPTGVMGELGYVSTGWLVVCGNTGRSHLLQADGFLADRYVEQHFGGHGEDVGYTAELICALTGRPGQPREAVDDMPTDREAYYNERAEQLP